MTDSPTSFEVKPFNLDYIIKLTSERSGTCTAVLKNKLHFSFFKNYFQTIEACTAVIEHNYTDHDYLEDYAAYYSRCFKSYDRACRRIHFFKSKFDHKDFSSFLRGEKTALTADGLQHGVVSVFLGLFGSMAGNNQKPDSDIDLLVRFSEGSDKSLFDLVQLEKEMVKIFHRKVDLLTEASISSYILPDVLKTMKTVYAQ